MATCPVARMHEVWLRAPSGPRVIAAVKPCRFGRNGGVPGVLDDERGTAKGTAIAHSGRHPSVARERRPTCAQAAAGMPGPGSVRNRCIRLPGNVPKRRGASRPSRAAVNMKPSEPIVRPRPGMLIAPHPALVVFVGRSVPLGTAPSVFSELADLEDEDHIEKTSGRGVDRDAEGEQRRDVEHRRVPPPGTRPATSGGSAPRCDIAR